MTEFKALKGLRKSLKMLPNGFLGPGDDCAIIPWKKGYSLALSTDSLVEGIHFYPDIAIPDLLFKSLQVNLSDLAAKGAKPLGCLFSLSLPRNKAKDLIKYLRHFSKLCHQSKIHLLGGDSTASKSGVFINLTVIGVVQNSRLKLRSNTKAGQVLAVSDFLGNSAAGFELLKLRSQSRQVKTLIASHLRPRAELEAGTWLSAQKAVCSMMDLSDGLASDIERIIEMSHCGFRIDLDRIPLSPELQQASCLLKKPILHYALEGGEDYKLLCSIEKKHFSRIQKAFQKKFGRPLYEIGHALKDKELHFYKNGRPQHLNLSPFQHFSD